MQLGKNLLASARDGDTASVKGLINRGAPFTTDWLGTSPLHLAAQFGHLDTCTVLLRAGLSKDAKTKVDKTPVHVAAQEGHADVIDLLLRNGADVDAADMVRDRSVMTYMRQRLVMQSNLQSSHRYRTTFCRCA